MMMNGESDLHNRNNHLHKKNRKRLSIWMILEKEKLNQNNKKKKRKSLIWMILEKEKLSLNQKRKNQNKKLLILAVLENINNKLPILNQRMKDCLEINNLRMKVSLEKEERLKLN